MIWGLRLKVQDQCGICHCKFIYGFGIDSMVLCFIIVSIPKGNKSNLSTLSVIVYSLLLTPFFSFHFQNNYERELELHAAARTTLRDIFWFKDYPNEVSSRAGKETLHFLLRILYLLYGGPSS